MRIINAVARIASRLAILGAFAFCARFGFIITTNDLTAVRTAGPAYLALLHKRDSDPLFMLPPVLARRGFGALGGEVQFGLRGDAFAPGFLARMAPHPRWLARMIRPINAGPALRFLGAHPLHGLLLRPAETWIRRLARDDPRRPAGAALAPEFIGWLAGRVGDDPATLAQAPLTSLLGWRYQLWLQDLRGPEILAEATRRAVQRDDAAEVKQQLSDVAGWLHRGGAVLGAPEGGLSPDGGIQPIGGGFQRIIGAAPAATAVVPLAISYDFMTVGRMRVFIGAGPAIAGAGALDRRALEARLRAGWRQATTFTATQIGAGILVGWQLAGKTHTTTAEFAATLGTRAAALAAQGRRVDAGLLQARTCRRRARRWLAGAGRRGVARRDAGGWVVLPVALDFQVPPGEVGYLPHPLAYAWHELHDLLDGQPLAADAALATGARVGI